MGSFVFFGPLGFRFRGFGFVFRGEWPETPTGV